MRFQERLERTVRSLEGAGIPYAIIGGNAVRAWVAQVDETAVRTTGDADTLLRRSDLPAAVAAFEQTGFVYRHVKAGVAAFDELRHDLRQRVPLAFGDRVDGTSACS